MPLRSTEPAPGSRPGELLTPRAARAIASELGLRPAKRLGQNFVIDQNTIRRIVRLAGVRPGERVLEVGPGLGSLTLGLLGVGAAVVAVEVDPRLAARLPQTVAELQPGASQRLNVVEGDALRVNLPLAVPDGGVAQVLVANLPYNVAVPVLLRLLTEQPSIGRALVMVQAEVAARLAAEPGSQAYGAPSAKLRWFGRARWAGDVPAQVFWPVPRVESGLVLFERGTPPKSSAGRAAAYACIDAAFAQRRKMLRRSLGEWSGSASPSEILAAARVDPADRAEVLDAGDFARIADARSLICQT